jgi:hypothetical protein
VALEIPTAAIVIDISAPVLGSTLIVYPVAAAGVWSVKCLRVDTLMIGLSKLHWMFTVRVGGFRFSLHIHPGHSVLQNCDIMKGGKK